MSQSSIVLQALDQLDRIFGAPLIPDPSFLPCMRQAHPRQDDDEPLGLACVPTLLLTVMAVIGVDCVCIVAGTPQARRPATGAFLRAHIADWSRVRHIGGAYSYPTLGARKGDREALAAPVGGRLFFAGEATHPAVNPCLQAALETGARAAAQVAAALQRPHSSL